MRIVDLITELLKDGPLSMTEIRRALLDVPNGSIGATLSRNKDVFVRLDNGMIGLVGRDENSNVKKRYFNNSKIKPKETNLFNHLKLHKRIFNLLMAGPMRIESLCEKLGASEFEVKGCVGRYPKFFRRKRDLIWRK